MEVPDYIIKNIIRHIEMLCNAPPKELKPKVENAIRLLKKENKYLLNKLNNKSK